KISGECRFAVNQAAKPTGFGATPPLKFPHRPTMTKAWIPIGLLASSGALGQGNADTEVAQTVEQAKEWRAEHRIIDLHQHIYFTTQHLALAIKIMDAVGAGIGVNLTAGVVTKASEGGTSEFERNKTLADVLYPGRFVHYMNLDYTAWDKPDFAQQAAKQIEEG